VVSTAHQTVAPATLGRNSASLEGHDTALATLRLARGLVTPSGEVPSRSGAGRPLEWGPLEWGSASLEGRSPPRARSCLARGWTPPWARFRLTWGPHGPATFTPAPPTGAFNALTFAGAQVKGESAPRRTWESRPGAVPPNPNYPYSYPLKTLIWISVFVFVLNMDVRWIYLKPIFNIIRIRHYPKYLTKIRHIWHYSYPQK
jgi:hypothetical protein